MMTYSLNLDEYEAANLLSLMQAMGWDSFDPQRAQLPVNTGDWFGAVQFKLKSLLLGSTYHPNRRPDEIQQAIREHYAVQMHVDSKYSTITVEEDGTLSCNLPAGQEWAPLSNELLVKMVRNHNARLQALDKAAKAFDQFEAALGELEGANDLA